MCAVGGFTTFVTYINAGGTDMLAFLVSSLAIMVSKMNLNNCNVCVYWLPLNFVCYEILTCIVIANRHYQSHVRLHFITNLAVSGGLVMLQSFGAGRYTVDHLLKKKL